MFGFVRSKSIPIKLNEIDKTTNILSEDPVFYNENKEDPVFYNKNKENKREKEKKRTIKIINNKSLSSGACTFLYQLRI